MWRFLLAHYRDGLDFLWKADLACHPKWWSFLAKLSKYHFALWAEREAIISHKTQSEDCHKAFKSTFYVEICSVIAIKLYLCILYANPCLQVWRGTIARMRYRRMRAALTILQAYRRYKVKSYIREVNRRFKNVRSMKDHGRHVKWPTPPKVLRRFEEALKSIHSRYSTRKHLPR